MIGLRYLVVPFLSASMLVASAVAVMAADAPPPPKSAEPAVPSSKSASTPMIVQNHDGTFTVQKAPPKDTQINNGLVIPPQVVVPIFSAVEKKH
jgi:hypothetical protein